MTTLSLKEKTPMTKELVMDFFIFFMVGGSPSGSDCQPGRRGPQIKGMASIASSLNPHSVRVQRVV